MRTYQEIGLTSEAKKFLEENCKKVSATFCPHCKEMLTEEFSSTIYKKPNPENIDWADGAVLRDYNLKDGRTAREIIQAEPWSSGPVSFWCLNVSGETMFQWTEEEMNQYL